MSLKTCKILQTIAVILFALALLIAVLSVPLKNALLRLVYPGGTLSALDTDVFAVSVFPSMSFIAALVYLGISLIHFTVLKNPLKKHVLASVIACSIVFCVYKVSFPALNDYFINRALLRGEADGSAYFSAYAMLENALYGILSFLTVPGSILMFLSLGGSIGRGMKEAAVADNKANAAEAVQNGSANINAPASVEPAAQKPSAPKAISLPELEEPSVDAAVYHAAFKRPSGDAPEPDALPASDDSEAYRKAFQRPKAEE